MNKTSIKVVLLFLSILAIFAIFPLKESLSGIRETPHDLSVTSGSLWQYETDEICVFCHTPHSAEGTYPLWNRNVPAQSFDMYNSPTFEMGPAGPIGTESLLCMSCHDGTIAIGSVVNLGGAATTISMHDTGTGYLTGGRLSPTAPGYIGTDLSGHHPVSIEVNDALISDKGIQCNNYEVSFRVCYPQPPLKQRTTDNRYGAGPHTGEGVQCTSCHDAHSDPNPGTTKFLRVGTASDTTDLCMKCHFFCDSACP